MVKQLLPVIIGCLPAFVADAVPEYPYIIFSGDGGESKALSLKDFDRITFGKNSMTVSSSVNSDKKVELLYSAFNQFRMDKDVMTGISGITSPRFTLNYDRSTSCLSVVGEGDSRYSLGVFTLDGILVMQADIREGENLSVATIEEGVYIAVALGEEDAQEIKFVR